MIFARVLLIPSVAYVGRSPSIGSALRPCVRHSPVRAAEAASEAEMVGEVGLASARTRSRRSR